MAESKDEPEINQPGLDKLREAVANAPDHLPGRRMLRKDGLAGLNSALASVPDGMASGILAGVNPIYGLYACMAGPIAGGLVSSTQLMVVTTTSAAALGAGQALVALPAEERTQALFVLVLLVGAFQIAFGFLRLGKLTRFVSYSVMTGFITGIAVLTVLTQLPTATGYEPSGDTRVSQTIDIILNIDEVEVVSVGLTALTIAVAIGLRHTFIGNFGNLVAIVLPSVAVLAFGLDSIQKVSDVGDIPSGVPLPALPDFSVFSADLVTGAAAVAAVILVQGAGVSQSVPNPDGSRRSTSRDFVGQGAANVVSALFRGLPVGASLGTTALSVLSGATSRWAAIFAGVWIGVIIIVFTDVVAYIAMPTLAALLMIASASTIKPIDVETVWETGWPSRAAIITTFIATLLLPIQVAVGLGVALSAILYLAEASTDVSVVELVERDDGRIEERKAPKQLESDRVTVLDVYGHLFFAGARALGRLLPEPNGAENPAVILRMRGRANVGATLLEVLAGYVDDLSNVNGRLYMSGLSPEARDQIARSEKLSLNGPVSLFEATSIRGDSTRLALEQAEAWIVRANH